MTANGFSNLAQSLDSNVLFAALNSGDILLSVTDLLRELSLRHISLLSGFDDLHGDMPLDGGLVIILLEFWILKFLVKPFL